MNQDEQKQNTFIVWLLVKYDTLIFGIFQRVLQIYLFAFLGLKFHHPSDLAGFLISFSSGQILDIKLQFFSGGNGILYCILTFYCVQLSNTMLKHIPSNLTYYAANIFFLSQTCHRFVLIPLAEKYISLEVMPNNKYDTTQK